MIQYLLDQPDFHVIMASRTVSKAENMIDGHPQGEAFSLDVNDDKKVEDFVSKADVVVSLLPYTYHVKVAEMCIKHKKHMITTSYVSDAMRSLWTRKQSLQGFSFSTNAVLTQVLTICLRCGSSMILKRMKERS